MSLLYRGLGLVLFNFQLLPLDKKSRGNWLAFSISMMISSHFSHSSTPCVPAEAFTELSDADVEACPLVISYTSVSGGAQPRSKEGHMRNQQEHVLVVHHRGELRFGRGCAF